MEEVDARIVGPTVVHQHLTARFHDPYPTAKKRALPFDSSSFLPQNTAASWNLESWNWDSAKFVAKPLQCNGGQTARGEEIHPRRKQASYSRSNSGTGEGGANLQLKLRGGGGTRTSDNMVQPQAVSKPNKRVRSGSPGGTNYPMCQVDNCKQDLSTAKDYHRRHKVCEVHSKAGEALVGKQMQRFCQQCSRFHPLQEFDEGKRSCRRRLAGHNRRRRKTQPEDTTQRMLALGVGDNNVRDNDILNLLAVLTHAQESIVDKNDKVPSIPSKDQLLQILSKINSLQSPENLAAKLNGSNSNHISSENQNQINGNASSASTMDLLAALSATTKSPSDVLEAQSQPSTEGSDSEKSKSVSLDKHGGSPMEFQETSRHVPLNLFSPSPEDHRPAKMASERNFLSSSSSCPSDERSPLSSPPVVYDLFPMHTSRDTEKIDSPSNSEGETAYSEATAINRYGTSLQLFGASITGTEDVPAPTSSYRAGYTSSVSDHSPSSQNSDAQDRTGKITLKLFDKDPSHMPGSLRAQISNWLSNSPSEMESYIRPGCVVLSLYLSMPSFAWDQLEENLLNYVKSLVEDIDVDFWGNGRFLIHTDRHMVSHKEGKIRLCKSLRAWSTPQLISVSPLAVVGGQQTTLLLRGRSLKAPGTKIHCTLAAGYNVREHSSSCQKTPYNEIILDDFKVNGAASGVLGRCFIEVENCLRGASFPVIIADSTICQELRLLEPEINGTSDICNGYTTDNIEKTAWIRSREESLFFLNELGWLFQRKYSSCLFEIPEYRFTRFKYLLVFSVEHDFCALVKALLDILLELNSGRKGIEEESLKLLSEIHLLNRAVKRRCRGMVDFLIHYSVVDSTEKFIFVPNMAGPGGLTPLHLAASASSSDDIVDILTSDPQEVGLHSWNSVVDSNGLSPYAYALMRNNHSYNALVARKLAGKRDGEVSVTIEDVKQWQLEVDKEGKTKARGQQSCSRCAYGYRRRIPGTNGLLQRPYAHSMLLVAAVCVCVCLFLRGHPFVGRVSPFSWDKLGFGTI